MIDIVDILVILLMKIFIVQVQKGEPMIKVPYGQEPYSVIGKYIRDHITAIEDIIAVIEIDDITTNQLFMVDMDEENYFIWENDWYEGEKDIALIDFFPVSEAINPSAQPQTEWNNHTVACLLAELFGDACACNYNGIDEWLPEKCEVIDACPNPVGVACWEQFLTHRAERRTDGEIIPE